jgi:4-amino-4-deoxy-L-arabinose transferase-like glycosyltransferase
MPEYRKKLILWIIVIFLAALLLRLSVILIWTPAPYPDWLEYVKLAESIVKNGSFSIDGVSNTYRAPIYPAFLAAIYYFSPDHLYRIATIIQSLLSATTCVLIFLLVNNRWGIRIGLFAGIVAAIAPDLILYCAYLLTETLYIFLMTLLLYLLIKYTDKSWGAVFSGILLGTSALIRPLALIFLPFIIYWARKTQNAKIHRIILISLLTLLVIIPWSIRNYYVSDSIQLVSSAGPVNLWLGNNEDGTGKFNYEGEKDKIAYSDTMTESEKNSQYCFEVYKFISQKPLSELRLLALKFVFFITPSGERYFLTTNNSLQNIFIYILSGIFFEFLFIGTAISLFMADKKNTAIFKMYIYTTLIFVLIFFFLERFRITAYPAFIPLSTIGWVYLINKENRRKKLIIVLLAILSQIILSIIALVLSPEIIRKALAIFM